ncbi:MAG: hypothetical protein RLP12_03550 [Ekhidna sp.]
MKKILLAIVVMAFIAFEGESQKRKGNSSNTPTYSKDLYEGMQWRNIGPFRGGRSAAVTGVPGKTNLYYMGTTGGGVWRTKEGGQTW